jgi:AcrR family transcriptional regulator
VPKVSEEHLEGRRHQMTEEALAWSSRQGFYRPTMQDDVRESGLSAGAVYRYFESKESIVAALAEEHHRSEAAALAGAHTAADATEALAAVARKEALAAG